MYDVICLKIIKPFQRNLAAENVVIRIEWSVYYEKLYLAAPRPHPTPQKTISENPIMKFTAIKFGIYLQYLWQ